MSHRARFLVYAALFLGVAATASAEVKPFAFTFNPPGGEVPGLTGKTVLVAVFGNKADLAGHVKDVARVVKNVPEDQRDQVFGVRYNGYGMPLHRWVTEQPFETIVADGIAKELEALGCRVVRASAPLPASFDPEPVKAWLSGQPAADLVVGGTVRDFWFQTTVAWKVNIEHALDLDVRWVNAATGAALWQGSVNQDRIEKQATSGRDENVRWLDESFAALMSKVARTNDEVRAALAPKP